MRTSTDKTTNDKMIGLRKKDLIISHNLKSTFELINQHLYAKLKHTDTDTRARSKEIVNLLICKLVDETQASDDDYLEFCIREKETPEQLGNRIQLFFTKIVKKKYGEIIGEDEKLNLNQDLIYLVIEELQNISLLQSSKDVLNDAFEVFVSKILKDEGGQFFTPANIVGFMVKYLNPTLDSEILDPACGHGGFLLEVKDHLWKKIDAKYEKSEEENIKKKAEIASHLYGIDKDMFLVKICKLYIDILSGGNSRIFCENSLDPISYRLEASKTIINDEFDIILTNPPFGSKIPIDQEKVLQQYDLAHKWKVFDESKWIKQEKLVKKQPPQILFIERCVQLLREGGKLGIILPEGIFGNPSDRYIWEFLVNKGRILGVISLDQNTFQPYTCNKTSILFFQKLESIPADYSIDFAIVDNVGHDKDGKVLYKLNKDGTFLVNTEGKRLINDDLIDLEKRLETSEDFDNLKDQKFFKIKINDIKNNIFIPSYYLGVERTLKQLSNDKNFELISIGELVADKIIFSNKNGLLPRGDEIGSQVYGLGDVPFIRTSEIGNWEINLNSNKMTSEEVYELYRTRQNIEVGDILLVKDGGSNLIGNIAFVSDLDTKIIIQSHIFQIKTLENNDAIDPYLLMYLLHLEIVQRQIQAITFIQGTIATIGNRIMDVKLPIPASLDKRKRISQHIRAIIEAKTDLKRKLRDISLESFM